MKSDHENLRFDSPKKRHRSINLIEKAEKAQADLIEVRLITSKFPQTIQTSLQHKKSLNCHEQTQSEKGFFVEQKLERQKTFKAAKSGFEYVDVDLSSPKHKETINQLKQWGQNQSFPTTNSMVHSAFQQWNILEKEIASGASVCKIVTTAKQVEDNLPALSFVSFASERQTGLFLHG